MQGSDIGERSLNPYKCVFRLAPSLLIFVPPETDDSTSFLLERKEELIPGKCIDDNNL